MLGKNWVFVQGWANLILLHTVCSSKFGKLAKHYFVITLLLLFKRIRFMTSKLTLVSSMFEKIRPIG